MDADRLMLTQKYHKIVSLAVGILFVVILQELSLPKPIFRFLVPALALFSLAVFVYNSFYLKSLKKYNFWIALRPFLLSLSGFGIFLIIPSLFLRGIFLIASAAIFALVEYFLDSFAENILINETLLIAFGFFISLSAFTQYFPNIGSSLPLHLSLQIAYTAAAFLAAYLTTRAFYEFTPQPDAIKNASAIAIGLFCSEFFWGLSFLPFHYSVAGLLLFNLFYFSLILNYYHMFQALNFKKIQFHLALIVLCSGIALLATPWKIIG